MTYAPDKIANFAKNVADDYARWLKSSTKLTEQILAGIAEGHTARKIETDMLSRCSTREQMINVLSTITALQQLGKLDGYERETRV